MAGNSKKGKVYLGLGLAALLMFAGLGMCSAAPAAPKLLSVVVGEPFEEVPASGPSKISITVAPEETEPATFTVQYSNNLKDVKLAVASELTGPGKIERGDINVYEVSGTDLISKVSQSSGAVYAQTDLGPQPRQFWVTVTVPRRTPPGMYKGLIGVYYNNKTFDTIPLEVHVLPLRLIGSSKQYLLYTSYGPSGEGEAALCGADYEKFMSAFSSAGVRGMSVNAAPAIAGEVISAYKESGLANPMPIVTYAFDAQVPDYAGVSSLKKAVRSNGISSELFFTVDLPGQNQLDEARQQITAFKMARGTAVARLSDESVAAELEKDLDGLVYWIGMQYPQSLLSGEATRTSNKWQWIWWDARESAKTNRLNAGVKLWKAGLDGAMPAWMPIEGVSDPLADTNSLLTEALREGVDDTRYLTSFMKALREAKDLKRTSNSEYISTSEAYVNDFLAKPLDSLTTAQLAGFRAKLVEYTLGLEKRAK